MAKSDDEKKEKSPLVQTTVPREIKDIINDILVGKLGTNESDVVGKIITMWFYEQDWFRETIKKKV